MDLGPRNNGFSLPKIESLSEAAAKGESITLHITDETWLVYYPRRVQLKDVMIGNVISCCYGKTGIKPDWTRPPLVYVFKANHSAFSGQITLTADVQSGDVGKRQITVRWRPLDTRKMHGYRARKELAGRVPLPRDSDAAFRMGVLNKHIQQIKTNPVSTLQLLPHPQAHLWVNSDIGYIENVEPKDVITIVVPTGGIDYSKAIVVGKHDVFVSRTSEFASGTDRRLASPWSSKVLALRYNVSRCGSFASTSRPALSAHLAVPRKVVRLVISPSRCHNSGVHSGWPNPISVAPAACFKLNPAWRSAAMAAASSARSGQAMNKRTSTERTASRVLVFIGRPSG